MRSDQAKGAALVLAGLTGLTGAAWAIRHRQKKGKSYEDLDSECSDLMLWVVNMLLSNPLLSVLTMVPHCQPCCVSAQVWCPSRPGSWRACEHMRAGKQIPSSGIL